MYCSTALRVCFGAALLGLTAWAAEPRPSPAEEERFLAESREAALKYSESLPDFICTQKIQRFIRTNRTNWRRLDILTVQLANSPRGEEYKLVAIDGAPTDRTFESLVGTTSQGEFGSLLRGVFDPLSATEFRFERWTSVNGARAAVYAYQVAPVNSRYQLQFYDTSLGLIITAQAGHVGEVVIDRQTHAVYRITSIAEKIPRSYPMRHASFAVAYEYEEVGGRSYLLPSEAVSEGRTATGSTRNITEFVDYRKFTSGSVITFGTGMSDKR